MEKRKNLLSTLRMCRFCLAQDESLSSLYERDRGSKKSVPLSLKILSCVSIEVYPSDKMPSYICKRCKFFMALSYDYKNICRDADERILQYVQRGTHMSSVPWPASLTKIFSSQKSGNEVGVMKTVEGGATVQVTAEESDMSEDEDSNVYDVKIGDDSGEGPKNTRVKVVTSNQNKRKQTKDMDDTNSSEGRVAHVREGCWPCDQCDCTYTLKQLLELHIQQKHRERTEECDLCDAKFFSPYDLVSHKLRHSEEITFDCIACDKKFKRLFRLKRHEKIVHADLPQLPCPNCPATFLSLEQLEEHQKRHIRNVERKYACPTCDKRFSDKSILQKHQDNIHNKTPEFVCEYCPERFTTVSKLTRHVRQHATERPYPCKYCNKSFLKSHHYTRHLRFKHHETKRSSRGPFGEGDQFKCEQCEDAFATQDDLIYHSAIHATQNLTCPLCQERFDNVDAVTAHIKSHANGLEFMCDMCELVFTNKDKLDKHIIDAHEDEMDNEDENEEESMETEVDDEDDDNSINVKEQDGEMVVEIKKPDEFLLPNIEDEDIDEKMDNTNSEESETEHTYTELSTVDTLALATKDSVKPKIEDMVPITAVKTAPAVTRTEPKLQASIIRKAEEAKRKSLQQKSETPIKKDKPNNKPEGAANDKSLRLLEKELQELKRTNTRSEAVKTPVKPLETLRSRRPQIHTSTPKPKPVIEEKKIQTVIKSAVVEKKAPERRILTKENKEPKEPKANIVPIKEEKEQENTEKEPPKVQKTIIDETVKNGNANTSNKTVTEETIRRSTRPSKIKDYAKMIRDGTQDSNDDDDSDVDEEYKEAEKSLERKGRRSSIKPPAKAAPVDVASNTTPTGPRKRGRPRKDATVPAKVKKNEEEEEEVVKTANVDSGVENKSQNETTPQKDSDSKTIKESSNMDTSETKSPSSRVLMSPTGQTLKKVAVKSLPPGVKPLPLPPNARTVNSDLCEMQIGKKMVKVQKIVMTKAEVEAMAKKGLVEIKDGTMMLKQGIKLPTSDHTGVLKSSVAAEDIKESPTKTEKAAPTRCNFDEDS